MATNQEARGRCLKTAAHSLQALRLLGAAPQGVEADELAIHLGKSKPTARYLLNTLCQEKFAYKDSLTGSYHLCDAPPWGEVWGSATANINSALPDDLTKAVSELYSRTRQRTYLAHLDGEQAVVVDARGHQGLARIPGLQEHISPGEAHALALTKTLAAASPGLEDALCQEGELTSFTGATFHDPDAFARELDQVRQGGFAVDREEFAEGFCCVAAPILSPVGDVAASLAISTSPQRLASDYVSLVNSVVEVAAIASEEWRKYAISGGAEQVGADPPSPSPHPHKRGATAAIQLGTGK